MPVYNAFGDSITAGSDASIHANDYVSLLAAHYGWPIANHGVGGAMVPDQAGLVFATSPCIGDVSTVWLGTNEKNWYGDVIARQPIFQMGHLALLMQLGIEQSAKTMGQSMATFGTWADIGPTIDPNGIYTSANGAACYANPVGRHVVVSGWWNTTPGSQFYVDIDGRLYGPFSGQTPGGFNPTQNAAVNYGPFALVFTDLPSAGPHPMHIVNTSANGIDVFVSYVAGLNGPGPVHPLVATANVYNYTALGDQQQGTNPARNGRFSSLIQYNVAICRRLGLNVVMADVQGVMTDADISPVDNLHPIDSGHAKIFTEFQQAIDGYVMPTDILAKVSVPTFCGLTYIEGGHLTMSSDGLELGS